ncbi:MAG: AAA family ATPase [Planctomycetota bacterium]
MSEPAALVERLSENVRRVFVGKDQVVELVLAALLAEGHLLIEDAPGVGKTTLAKALARSIDCAFKRVQFTPDLLPSDITGVSIYDQHEQRFVFKQGPVFANVVLADEINRTNPRTQSALLEAMSEGSVSVDGETRALPRPFLVLATQNPYEFEGTYPLPESQLDRFLIRLEIGYPSPEQERAVLQAQRQHHPLADLKPVVTGEQVLSLQAATREVRVDDAILDYIVAISHASRAAPEVAVGVSPRGSLALRRAAQGLALVRSRDYVIPDDVKELAPFVLPHRILVNDELGAGRTRAREVLSQLLERVPAPL